MALQGGPCRVSVQESLYYLGPHHPGFKGKQACLRAVVQLPLVALEAHPPCADPPVYLYHLVAYTYSSLLVACHTYHLLSDRSKDLMKIQTLLYSR